MRAGDVLLVAGNRRAFECAVLCDSTIEDLLGAPGRLGELLEELRPALHSFRRVLLVERRECYGSEYLPMRDFLFLDAAGRWWTINGVSVSIEVLRGGLARQFTRWLTKNTPV